MPTLYPGDLSTKDLPYATIADKWAAFNVLAHNGTHAVAGERYAPLPAASTTKAPTLVPTHAPTFVHHATQNGGRSNSRRNGRQTSGSWSSPHFVMQVTPTPYDPFLADYNHWPLAENDYDTVMAVSASFNNRDPPLWTPLGSSADRRALFSQHRGHCVNCNDEGHDLRSCTQPFTNALSVLNPTLRQLMTTATLSLDGSIA